MKFILTDADKGRACFEESGNAPDDVRVSGQVLDCVVAAIYEILVGSPMGSGWGYRLESLSGYLGMTPSKSTLTIDGLERVYYKLSGVLDVASARLVYKSLVAIGFAADRGAQRCSQTNDSFEEYCANDFKHPIEDLRDAAEDVILCAERSTISTIPYDELEADDRYSALEGDLDNYWNEPGRLEYAVYELEELLEESQVLRYREEG